MLATVILRKPNTTDKDKGDEKRVQNILVKAKNDEAEKLWNYILAYRKRMNPARNDGVTFVVPPPLEQVKIIRSKKQNSSTA